MTQCETFRERDGWHCPASVAHLENRVLYQAVAYWALQQGRGVTVQEVSEAFAIVHRRASDVLHYIVNDAREAVQSSVSLDTGGGSSRKKVVRVWRVYPQRFPQVDKVATKISGLSKRQPRRVPPDGEIQRLRTWFLSRRLGETFPQTPASGVSEEKAEPALNGQNCGQ